MAENVFFQQGRRNLQHAHQAFCSIQCSHGKCSVPVYLVDCSFLEIVLFQCPASSVGGKFSLWSQTTYNLLNLLSGFILSIKTKCPIQSMPPSLQATFVLLIYSIIQILTAGNLIIMYFGQFLHFSYPLEANQKIWLVSLDCVYFQFVFFVLLDLKTMVTLPSINY